MAQDTQSEGPTSSVVRRSIIENEIPTYRAVSTWAIASLLLGLLSALSFANTSFLVASVASIVTGAIALGQLKRYTDLLTGRKMANAGIALGLVCGLASTTINYTQGVVIDREAKRFAEEYCQALATGELANPLYLQAPTRARANTTPGDFYEEMRKQAGQEFDVDPRTQVVRGVFEKLAKGKDEHVHVSSVEDLSYSGLVPVAAIVLRFEGPEADKDPANQYALLVLKGEYVEGKRGWYVDNLQFPYAASTKSNVVESAHGHSHD